MAATRKKGKRKNKTRQANRTVSEDDTTLIRISRQMKDMLERMGLSSMDAAIRHIHLSSMEKGSELKQWRKATKANTPEQYILRQALATAQRQEQGPLTKETINRLGLGR